MSELGVGRQLGSYRIEAVLGRGGMGVVYRAADLRLGRTVALKLLATEAAGDARMRRRFLTESRLAAAIGHAGIVPVYDAGESDGHLFIAMRYVDGLDLAALLRREGGLEPERAVDLVAQVADALDVAHAHGLLHRDVKPSNVLIAREGSVEHAYLADFGLTKDVETPTEATASDGLVGTVGYMAPERIRGEAVDHRSDIYALGCVLFECLTGEPPFPRGSDVAAIYAHLEDDPPRPSERKPGLAPAFDAVIARALAKEPEGRWQSGAELVAAARGAVGGPYQRARPARRRVSRRLLLGFGAVAAILAVSVGLLLEREASTRTLAVPDADSVAVIDAAHASLAADVRVGPSPSSAAVGSGSLWVTNVDGGTLSRIDLGKRRLQQTIRVGDGPDAVAVGAGGVWVVNGVGGTVSWISPRTDTVVDEIPVNGPTGVCVAAGRVWIGAAYDRALVSFDPVNRRRRSVPLDDQPTRLTCGGGSVWASSEAAGSVTRIDPRSGAVVTRINAGAGANGLTYGRGALWVANTRAGTVSRIDPASNAETAVIPVGARARPANVAVGAGGVWVSDEVAGTVARIDPVRKRVDRTLHVGKRPQALAVVGGSLWVAVRASGAQHRGGTLRVLLPPDWVKKPSDLDSAIAYNIPVARIQTMTNDGLVAFGRTGGRGGAALVPDLATSLPTPTDRGRIYAFRLRRGVHYSTGAPVRATDIRRSIERFLRIGAVSADFYAGIRSARACIKRRAPCDLSPGISADDAAGTITFRLVAPDPDFLFKLAQTFAVAVPAGTPTGPIRRPLPATGPYEIARLDRSGVRLVRNPRFEPTADRPDGYPDAITFVPAADRAALRAVEANRADYTNAVATSAEAAKLRTRYAAQLHTELEPSTVFMFLNTRLAPFDDVRVRRALNYAVDRVAVGRLEGNARPTCQIIPPNFPGHRVYCPYTTSAASAGAPDLEQARRLLARARVRGARVTVWGPASGLDRETRYVARLLEELGFRARLRLVPDDGDYFGSVRDPRNHAQIGAAFWRADYPAASNFLLPLFSCGALHDHSGQAMNLSRYCDRRSERLTASAQRLQLQNRPSDEAWARAERRLVDQAVAVPLTTPNTGDLVSTRVGHYENSPVNGVLLDQLWVR